MNGMKTRTRARRRRVEGANTVYTLRMLDSLFKKSVAFVRSEPMPGVAFLCAAVSCFFVPAGHDFFATIDLRVLALLFCLMTAVDGLRSAGLFSRCARVLIEKTNGLRALSFVLVALPFFASMLVTNDVALLAFVPFAVDWQPLLLGVDLGGLGTPIASLASLIALRLYLHTPDADFARVMKEFVAANAIGLAGLVLLYCALHGITAL